MLIRLCCLWLRLRGPKRLNQTLRGGWPVSRILRLERGARFYIRDENVIDEEGGDSCGDLEEWSAACKEVPNINFEQDYE